MAGSESSLTAAVSPSMSLTLLLLFECPLEAVARLSGNLLGEHRGFCGTGSSSRFIYIRSTSTVDDLQQQVGFSLDAEMRLRFTQIAAWKGNFSWGGASGPPRPWPCCEALSLSLSLSLLCVAFTYNHLLLSIIFSGHLSSLKAPAPGWCGAPGSCKSRRSRALVLLLL